MKTRIHRRFVKLLLASLGAQIALPCARACDYTPDVPTGAIYSLSGPVNGNGQNPVLWPNQMLSGTGWASDPNGSAVAVTILIDGNTIGPAITDRYDPVHGSLSGWTFAYNIGSLAAGSHTLEVSVENDLGGATNFSDGFTVVTGLATVLTCSAVSLASGESAGLVSTTASPTGILVGQAIDVSTDNVHWTSGWGSNGPGTTASNWVGTSISTAGPTAWSGGPNGTNTLAIGWTPTAPGTYYFRARGEDNQGNLSAFSYATVTVSTTAPTATQIPVTSLNLSIPYGTSFTPSYYPAEFGGSGSGAWQFAINGETFWDGGTSGFAGTNLDPVAGNSPGAQWVQSWTPPGPGTYLLFLAHDGDGTYLPALAATYTLTVTGELLPQPEVYSSNKTITVGTPFNPVSLGLCTGGMGTGGWQFCIAGYTDWDCGTSSNTGTNNNFTTMPIPNWQSSWTPPGPGTYEFWVAHDGDSQYAPSIPTGFYTLTVVPAVVDGLTQQAPVSTANVLMGTGLSFTAPHFGGSGAGGWQFCIASQTNWDGGDSAFSGTNLGTSPGNSPGAQWSQSWNPPGSATYTFSVARDGDGTYSASNQASGILTVDSTLGDFILTVVNGGWRTFTTNPYVFYLLPPNTAPTGQIFTGWTIVPGSGSGYFLNPNLANATFVPTSGTHAATVQPNYTVIEAWTNVSGDGVPDYMAIAAGMLDPADPMNPNDPMNTSSAANYQTYQYDNNNQVTSAPEGSFNLDNEGNVSPAH